DGLPPEDGANDRCSGTIGQRWATPTQFRRWNNAAPMITAASAPGILPGRGRWATNVIKMMVKVKRPTTGVRATSEIKGRAAIRAIAMAANEPNRPARGTHWRTLLPNGATTDLNTPT